MATIKTDELTGSTLDLAVAMADPQCAGLQYRAINGVVCGVDPEDDIICIFFMETGARLLEAVRAQKALGKAGEYAEVYSPSSDWKKGGMLIQQESIGISPPTSPVHRIGGRSPGWGESGYWSATTWHKDVNGKRSMQLHESSALIAAMRCYVQSKLGESVEIPADLDQCAAQAAQGGE